VSSELPDQPAPSRARGLILFIVKAAVSGGLLWLLFSRVDVARLWSVARTASPAWLGWALTIYLVMVVSSVWRWGLLLRAQGIHLGFGWLSSSFLVAMFFNNFLPSNIGGDVVRVADTSRSTGSKTLAATIVLVDRGIGLLGLLLVAAIGATTGPRLIEAGPGLGAFALWSMFAGAMLVSIPAILLPGALPRLLTPLRVLHPEWVDERLARLSGALDRFRAAPGSLVACFAGAVGVQALLVVFYLAIARSMNIPIGFSELAVVVPLSFIVQMAPVSMNGFGVREAVFGFYFTRLGLPLESALLVSFVGAATIMAFSLTGLAAYLLRGAGNRVPAMGNSSSLESYPERT
jgi:uncharacterized membrane protein YbhN (UPF0104 family)